MFRERHNQKSSPTIMDGGEFKYDCHGEETSSVSSSTNSSRCGSGPSKYRLTSWDEPPQVYKRNVSKWKQTDLDSLGIFYDNSSVSLGELTARAKQVAWRGHTYQMTTTPEHLRTFEEIMKETITLCLPYETGPRPATGVEAVSLITEIESIRENFFDHSTQTKAQMSLSREKER